jgi:hypothetical protein
VHRVIGVVFLVTSEPPVKKTAYLRPQVDIKSSDRADRRFSRSRGKLLI